jgi:putative DNA primase/helicase
MTRRTLVCSLDAGIERPELRKFKSDPVATVMADRGLYVSACLIIVRAYAAADYPGRLPTIASFEDWSDTVRSALVWLGCEDPAKSMEAARDDDPELADLREVIGL